MSSNQKILTFCSDAPARNHLTDLSTDISSPLNSKYFSLLTLPITRALNILKRFPYTAFIRKSAKSESVSSYNRTICLAAIFSLTLNKARFINFDRPCLFTTGCLANEIMNVISLNNFIGRILIPGNSSKYLQATLYATQLH